MTEEPTSGVPEVFREAHRGSGRPFARAFQQRRRIEVRGPQEAEKEARTAELHCQLPPLVFGRRRKRLQADAGACVREGKNKRRPFVVAERLPDKIDLVPAAGECAEHRLVVPNVRRLPDREEDTQAFW